MNAWTGRRIQVLLTAVMAALMSFVALPSADACACGGMFAREGSTLTVPTEKALVVHANDRTDVTMSLLVRSQVEDAGLVVPTPAPADVSLAHDDIFLALDRATLPTKKDRWHLVGRSDDGVGSGAAESATGAPRGVQELSSVDLGPLRATTLRAGDPASLRQWLTARGYVVRPAVQKILDQYVARGWAFVAMQLTAEGKELDGAIPPVTMSYPDKTFVYPMQLSRAATTRPTVTTYVLSDHRVRRTDASARTTTAETRFAADMRTRSGYVTAPLRTAVAKAPYLTVIEQSFNKPSTQVVSDFTFGRAATDEAHQPVAWNDKYVFTPDQFAFAVLALGAVVVALVVRTAGRFRRLRAQAR
ncbi:DUF2330 domain-containing protein [Yimella sp. cx-573]|nr:DUF2330 domain-containing protein [Yimella sp. cx-573]